MPVARLDIDVPGLAPLAPPSDPPTDIEFAEAVVLISELLIRFRESGSEADAHALYKACVYKDDLQRAKRLAETIQGGRPDALAASGREASAQAVYRASIYQEDIMLAKRLAENPIQGHPDAPAWFVASQNESAQRHQEVIGRLTAVEGRMTGLEERMAELDGRMGGLEIEMTELQG